jgi:hypothetical protein
MSNESEVRIFYLKVRMKREYLADDALKFKLVNVLGYFRGVSYELYAFNVLTTSSAFFMGLREAVESERRMKNVSELIWS